MVVDKQEGGGGITRDAVEVKGEGREPTRGKEESAGDDLKRQSSEGTTHDT